MKIRPSMLLLLALLVSPFAAHAVTAQSYCQYVCVDESCRLEQSADVPCGDATPAVLQAADDQEATACLPEPLTLDMVSDSSVPYTTTNVSKLAASSEEPQAPSQPPSNQPPTTPPGPAPAQPPADPVPPKKDVLLTGFCKFGDRTDNPTERILPALEKAVKDQCGANINLTSQCLDVTKEAIRKCTVDKRIVISLGVDGGSGKFRLETAAVNCYKDPFGKVKCDPECVDPAQPITDTATAPGPWPTLPGTIGTYPIIKGNGTSAGKYVCNATFYWLCTQKECKPYFIHTPDFPKEKDNAVVTDLAKLICDSIAANKTPVAKLMSFDQTR
jgi:pyrrolidone-carboxylate peptidase